MVRKAEMDLSLVTPNFYLLTSFLNIYRQTLTHLKLWF